MNLKRRLASPALALALTLGQASFAQTYGRLSHAYLSARQAARKIQPALGSSLSLGRCALGPAQACFERVLLGLAPGDRAYVRLSGERIVVAMTHLSRSSNFQALRAVANAFQGRTVIEILRPDQSYVILTQNTWPKGKLAATASPMGSPRTENGFEGYTFFPYHGQFEDGVLYCAAPYTLVVVNTDTLGADTITETIHHELRHVVLGGFGTMPAKAKHGLPAVEAATKQAEQEATRFERIPLTRPS